MPNLFTFDAFQIVSQSVIGVTFIYILAVALFAGLYFCEYVSQSLFKLRSIHSPQISI